MNPIPTHPLQNFQTAPPASTSQTKPSSEPPHVVALHGLAMGGYATAFWRMALGKAGFSTSSFSYRSLGHTLDQSAELLATRLKALSHLPVVHLAGHSLGGLVILRCLENHRFENLQRVALVGSPVQGSAPAANLSKLPLIRGALGKSIAAWCGPEYSKLPSHIEFGSIAGKRASGLGALVARFEGPHDGTVSVEETHLDVERARYLAHVSHTQMLVSPLVARQIAHFLRHGSFNS